MSASLAGKEFGSGWGLELDTCMYTPHVRELTLTQMCTPTTPCTVTRTRASNPIGTQGCIHACTQGTPHHAHTGPKASGLP
jgi:hypothetical protein